MKYPIVLASSSRFRKSVLAKLALPFETFSPDIEEQRMIGESPEQLVTRLSSLKAQAVSAKYPEHLIIGSDQVASINGVILGKPGDFDNARAQLQFASGKVVTFYTGLVLLNSKMGHKQTSCETFKVHFRDLTDEQITRYLEMDKPYDCAGSFKSEGLGIALFKKLDGDDPNTLIGLPLIKLIDMLEKEGISVP
jgi:MAF protein